MDNRPPIGYGILVRGVCGIVGLLMGLMQANYSVSLPSKSPMSAYHFIVAISERLNQPGWLAVIAAAILYALVRTKFRGWGGILGSWLVGGMIGSLIGHWFFNGRIR